MTEQNSKLTSAQVAKYAQLSIQLQCPLSGEKQHCRCNEVEHGGVPNKCFTSAEPLYNTADKGRLESQHFRAACFPFFSETRSLGRRLSNRRQIASRCVLDIWTLLGQWQWQLSSPKHLFWANSTAGETQWTTLELFNVVGFTRYAGMHRLHWMIGQICFSFLSSHSQMEDSIIKINA